MQELQDVIFLTKEDINEANVDDFIRQEKKRGIKKIYWNKKNTKIFKNFAKAVYHGNNLRFPRNFPKGQTFIGVKHICK